MSHTCCPNCDPQYLTRELGYPVCCHFQLMEESERAEPVDEQTALMLSTLITRQAHEDSE